MKQLLVIEDGDEYETFARLFLASEFAIRAAHSGGEALDMLAHAAADFFLLDLRFDRTPPEMLLGDVDATALRLFSGDRMRALHYIQTHQGTYVLGRLRSEGYQAPAIFVHPFEPRRLANLRQLYGDVAALPSFDAARLASILEDFHVRRA